MEVEDKGTVMRGTLRPGGEQPDGQTFGLVLPQLVGSLGCGRESEDYVESKGIVQTDAKARAHLPLELESRCRNLCIFTLVCGNCLGGLQDWSSPTHLLSGVDL